MYGESTPAPNGVLMGAPVVGIGRTAGRPATPPPPKPSSLLAATKGELEDAMKNLVDLNGRLGALADRVFGSQPETTGAAVGSASESFGVAAEIESRLNAIQALIQAAHYTVARLERI